MTTESWQDPLVYGSSTGVRIGMPIGLNQVFLTGVSLLGPLSGAIWIRDLVGTEWYYWLSVKVMLCHEGRTHQNERT